LIVGGVVGCGAGGRRVRIVEGALREAARELLETLPHRLAARRAVGSIGNAFVVAVIVRSVANDIVLIPGALRLALLSALGRARGLARGCAPGRALRLRTSRAVAALAAILPSARLTSVGRWRSNGSLAAVTAIAAGASFDTLLH